MMHVLIKRGPTDIHTGRTPGKCKGRDRVVCIEAKEHQRLLENHQKLEENHETYSTSGPSEGINPVNTLILHFWTTEL